MIKFKCEPTWCKRNHGKIFIRFLVIIFKMKNGCGPACSTKFSKIFWTTAYSMQKESWKNIHPFSCNNFINKKWVWPCRALLGGPACFTNFSKIFWTRAYSMQKESWKSIYPFSCNNFLNRKWAWSCHASRDADRTSTMHLQTLLNVYRVITKRVLKKYQTTFP